jgi:hypothetical protein
MTVVPLPSVRAAEPAANGASAYLFNMTRTNIVEVDIKGHSIGVKIPSMPAEPWQVSGPASLNVGLFFGTDVTVIFADGHKWTETIRAAPEPGKPPRNVGIWLFRNGCVVSTETGSIQQLTRNAKKRPRRM